MKRRATTTYARIKSGETEALVNRPRWPGVGASPAGKWFRADVDRLGRIKENPYLSVPSHSMYSLSVTLQWAISLVTKRRGVRILPLASGMTPADSEASDTTHLIPKTSIAECKLRRIQP